MRFRRSTKVDERLPALEARVAHLEAMVEGFQDSVYRDSIRLNDQLDELRKQLDPAELSRALSREKRERGT
jgi:uncharacterized coiled-coil protein SlyX